MFSLCPLFTSVANDAAMMRSFLLVLLLSLFSDASVLGVASPAHGVQPAPWRRLSNFLVETIWGRPAQPLSNTSERQRGYNGRQHVPGNFLARYGRDVVLRFNVTNAEEASSLAEAADVLFLDVWDFTENWLDVRLAKDVVSLSLRGSVVRCADYMRSGPVAARPATRKPTHRLCHPTR